MHGLKLDSLWVGRIRFLNGFVSVPWVCVGAVGLCWCSGACVGAVGLCWCSGACAGAVGLCWCSGPVLVQ